MCRSTPYPCHLADRSQALASIHDALMMLAGGRGGVGGSGGGVAVVLAVVVMVPVVAVVVTVVVPW